MEMGEGKEEEEEEGVVGVVLEVDMRGAREGVYDGEGWERVWEMRQ